MKRHSAAQHPVVWITWEFQRRNRGLAPVFGARLVEWGELDPLRPRPWKYLRGVTRTWRFLWRERPRLVFCQSPSLFLVWAAVLMRPLLGYRVVVDAHNAGLFPAEGRSRLLAALARWNQRHADLTIVSNAALAREVLRNGGRPAVLPDPLPSLPEVTPFRPPAGNRRILFVCTYAADEPYREVIAAAAMLPPECEVWITGDPAFADLDRETMPGNVRCTGYLPEEEYVAVLRGSDAVMVLTSRDDCLVCGAYEAVAAGRPMILSDTEALRRYFRDGAVFTGHSVAELASAMGEALDRSEELAERVVVLREAMEREWALQAAKVRSLVAELGSAPK